MVKNSGNKKPIWLILDYFLVSRHVHARDWMKYRIPCKHYSNWFTSFQQWGWEAFTQTMIRPYLTTSRRKNNFLTRKFINPSVSNCVAFSWSHWKSLVWKQNGWNPYKGKQLCGWCNQYILIHNACIALTAEVPLHRTTGTGSKNNSNHSPH